MDASRIFTLVFVLGVLLTLATAMTTEADLASSSSTEVMESTTTTTTTHAPPRNCATARGVAGACASRQECDHSTGPVDHSLYAPSWYKSPCLDGEVCCPFSAFVPELPRKDEYEDDAFMDK